jgi:hypothetical protein
MGNTWLLYIRVCDTDVHVNHVHQANSLIVKIFNRVSFGGFRDLQVYKRGADCTGRKEGHFRPTIGGVEFQSVAIKKSGLVVTIRSAVKATDTGYPAWEGEGL